MYKILHMIIYFIYDFIMIYIYYIYNNNLIKFSIHKIYKEI